MVSRRSGRVFPSLDDLLATDPSDGPATEILHFRVQSPRSAYGVPRWVGNLLAVLGSRQAEEVAARKREVAEVMRHEKSRVENFFEYCCVDSSFVTLRRRTRLDIELLGNGYWEVLRNGAGEIVQFVYVPGFTVRLLPLDPELVEIDHKVKLSDLSFGTTKVRHRFRR